MESRIETAVQNFEKGYNCSQAVFMTYCDLFGFDTETALKLSCSFGGGMGRMREVCGAVSAMFMLAGLSCGNTDPNNQDAKTHNYETVRMLADEFKKINGTIICRQLLGLEAIPDSAAPELRTEQYYKKRPCSQKVREAATIIETKLLYDIFNNEA